MSDTSENAVTIHERALRRALKEIVAQAGYSGVVPVPPDFATVMQRAVEIERTLMIPTEHNQPPSPISV